MTRGERLAAIRKALEHPQFYDGDMGADIRWLLGCAEQWIPRNQEEVAMMGHFLDRITDLKQQNERLLLERDSSREQFDKLVEHTADELAEVRAALKSIIETGDDCPACDRGVLRHPENGHWPECPFGKAHEVIAKLEGRR